MAASFDNWLCHGHFWWKIESLFNFKALWTTWWTLFTRFTTIAMKRNIRKVTSFFILLSVQDCIAHDIFSGEIQTIFRENIIICAIFAVSCFYLKIDTILIHQKSLKYQMAFSEKSWINNKFPKGDCEVSKALLVAFFSPLLKKVLGFIYTF